MIPVTHCNNFLSHFVITTELAGAKHLGRVGQDPEFDPYDPGNQNQSQETRT